MIYAVFIGGGLGALARYLISLAFGKTELFLPYQTLTANFLGCLIAGMVITYLSAKTNISPVYKTFIITGICGGLTTFSTFSLETVAFIQSGEYLKALIYAFASLFICIISVILGILIMKKVL